MLCNLQDAPLTALISGLNLQQTAVFSPGCEFQLFSQFLELSYPPSGFCLPPLLFEYCTTLAVLAFNGNGYHLLNSSPGGSLA